MLERVLFLDFLSWLTYDHIAVRKYRKDMDIRTRALSTLCPRATVTVDVCGAIMSAIYAHDIRRSRDMAGNRVLFVLSHVSPDSDISEELEESPREE